MFNTETSMASIDQGAITIFVPLIFGVVAQLSALARSFADRADDLVGNQPILLPVSEWSTAPNLGRLNYVHATNHLLLTSSFLLVGALETGVVKNVLGLLVLLIWLMLPLLEVDEYDGIREAGKLPLSVYFHAGSTLLVAGYLVAVHDPGVLLETGDLYAPQLSTLTAHPGQVGSVGGLSILWFASVYGYLRLLEWDVERQP